ncbi:hypothetical protein W02_16300 [Nitrospira sp. KM1]|uniref:YfgM family protein n=1 Tax=Nitrospira sp. KM1 TaxID=1936990 RepID=UPI0013A782A9|nr:tetratricopeptide repeat protein [Nitrospira sp. KM1]BCA54490.1 hypothetical protein W02_16300 [Nitrospira sp. KM1]
MSYRIKVPTKTLQVDEAHLISGLEHALFRLQEYRKPLLVAMVVFVLAAGIVGGIFWSDHEAAKKAEGLEREATRLFMNRSVSDAQKADSALKQAIEQYRQIVTQYPRTPAAPLAQFHLANALVQANDLAGGIEAYQRFLLLYGSHPSLVGLIQQRLAYAYLLKGDRDQAVKSLTGIIETPGALNKDQALFELARLEESQSRPEGALAHYQELIKSYPNSPYTSEATFRTKILDTKKAPEPPAPATVPPASSTAPSSKKKTRPASESGTKKP